MFKRSFFLFLIFQLSLCLGATQNNDNFGYVLVSFISDEALNRFKSEISARYNSSFREYGVIGGGSLAYSLIENLIDEDIEAIIWPLVQELGLEDPYLFWQRHLNEQSLRDMLIIHS
ncbi:MAG: hypothetical protein P4L22_06045 [Candidatus Babeliales bacterium]|nr:hypothetical protein [Candidatus Babeliales bacterium]